MKRAVEPNFKRLHGRLLSYSALQLPSNAVPLSGKRQSLSSSLRAFPMTPGNSDQ